MLTTATVGADLAAFVLLLISMAYTSKSARICAAS